MSVACGAGCLFCLGFTRWAWKRCTHVGADDSADWTLSTQDEFESIPRICRVILAVYEEDLHQPDQQPPLSPINPAIASYPLDPTCIIKRVMYDEQTNNRAPPYIIYIDHIHREIVLAIRGLNLMKESDYKVLLNNRLGKQMYDGGFVHYGLWKSAIWLLNQESETLRDLWVKNGKCYKMIFAGHSLGSGVVSLMTVILVNHRHRIGGIPRELVKCYAVAPARCMSLNMAVKYADVINSVILQDDFLPRTATPLEDIFGSIFCLPCLFFFICLRDTFTPEERKLKDPRRLYAPGRMYHIVERKFCRCGRFPPEVRTAIPVDGRFEHIVLSHNTTSDHAILWIQREAEKALQVMKEINAETTTTVAPELQRFERSQTLENEHKNALKRAVTLNVPHAVAPDTEEDPSPSSSDGQSNDDGAAGTDWDELAEKLIINSGVSEEDTHS